MGFRERLGKLGLSSTVGLKHLLLAWSVGAADGAGVLGVVDIVLEPAEDGDLAGDGVGGIGALDVGFDRLCGGISGGVVRRRGLGQSGCRSGKDCSEDEDVQIGTGRKFHGVMLRSKIEDDWARYRRNVVPGVGSGQEREWVTRGISVLRDGGSGGW